MSQAHNKSEIVVEHAKNHIKLPRQRLEIEQQRERRKKEERSHIVANVDYMQIKNTKGKGSNHLRLMDGVKVEDW